VIRASRERRSAPKKDLESQALALQDRLERGLGCELLRGRLRILTDGPVDEEAGPATGETLTYIARRVDSFYKHSREEWLTLIIKASRVSRSRPSPLTISTVQS
jgi:hypothetical protein